MALINQIGADNLYKANPTLYAQAIAVLQSAGEGLYRSTVNDSWSTVWYRTNRT